MNRTTQAQGALIIGGDYRALGVVRSLGRHGIPVWVLTNEHRVAAVSRYAQRLLDWPLEETDQLDYLLTLCNRHHLRDWAIFPSDDEAAVFLARHHRTLSTYFRLTSPEWNVLRWCYDKRLTSQIATETGVHQPRMLLPALLDDVEKIDLGFPAILKPAFKESLNRFTRAKAWRVDSRSELAAAYFDACKLVSPDIIMVQELIPGGGEEQVSFAAFCVDGRPVAWMTARRSRQFPLDFGRASSFVECVAVPEIEEPSRRLLKAIGYTGLVEVEFKRDPRDGAYKLLDINPRVWGWHTLGRLVGLDFPYIAWKFLDGATIPEFHAQSQACWMRLLTDVRAAFSEALQGRLTFPQYASALARPIEFAIFAFDDPVPALLDVPFLAWLGLRRRLTSPEASMTPPRVPGCRPGWRGRRPA